jgi:hypothetical protein
MEQRQAGGGEHRLERHRLLAKDAQAAVAHPRRGDEEPQRRLRPQRVEIDLFREDRAQRVHVEGVELIGREEPRRHCGRGVRACSRRDLADARPEVLEARSRLLAPALTPALGEAGRHHDGVDRAGARAAHHVEGEVLLLEQAVEHAPGKGAEGAAALQSERQPSAFARPLGAAGLW